MTRVFKTILDCHANLKNHLKLRKKYINNLLQYYVLLSSNLNPLYHLFPLQIVEKVLKMPFLFIIKDRHKIDAKHNLLYVCVYSMCPWWVDNCSDIIDRIFSVDKSENIFHILLIIINYKLDVSNYIFNYLSIYLVTAFALKYFK